MTLISFTEKAAVARAGSLFLKLLWLDELATEGLNKIATSEDAGDIETLIDLTDEMLTLLDDLEPAASLLVHIVEKSRGFLNAVFPDVVSRNAEYFTSRFDALRLEPGLLVERFEKMGGFENAALNSANTLLFESAGLRENLQRRKRDLANREVTQADFPHRIGCALFIGGAVLALVGGIAAGVPLLAAGGAATILAVEAPTASVFLTTIASAACSGCFD
jgi:hypothetical protein